MSRVVLRQWKDSDLEPFVRMNADREVRRYFPAAMSRQEASESFARMRAGIAERGWGVWAVEVDGVFAGATGLTRPKFAAPFAPDIEILWRFRTEFWGKGVAHAAAVRTLAHGFSALGLAEIVAFTATLNHPSIRLMERLGFVRDLEGDFEHPSIPVADPLRSHVLYRMKRAQWPETVATAVLELP
jgi:RimJ/RimL family protein N-acetyltransferase